MPREPYKITNADLPIAWEYVRRKLHIYPTWPKVGRNHIAKKEFIEMAKEPFVLQNWCDTWLSDKHWLRLKRAVWATKKRNRDKEVYEIKKQNRMSKKAWSVLSHEATRQNISMSDLVLQTFQIKESSKKR